MLSSILGSFQKPAYTASITLLVPQKHLGRASGLGQLSEAVSRVAAPTLDGLLVVTIHLFCPPPRRRSWAASSPQVGSAFWPAAC